MKSSHKGDGRVHVTETPDVSHIRNIDTSHEESDVQVKSIAIFVAGLTVMTVATCFLMYALFGVLAKREAEPQKPPMAMTDRERLPPEPRLQSAPGFGEALEKEVGSTESPSKPEEGEKIAPAQKESTTARPKVPLWEIQALNGYWKVVLTKGDTNKQILPIEEAKKKLLQQGLPVRTATTSHEGNGSDAQNYGVEMPTAASSGRVSERRKQ